MIVRLHPDHPECFPDPLLVDNDGEFAGLGAVGGDLSPRRLIAAYAQGFFPWYDAHSPLLWWSPDPRCLLLPHHFHLPRSLRRQLNRQRRAPDFVLRDDRAFVTVMQHCATMPRYGQDGTWILPEMIEAYAALHTMGVAHSIEVWTRPAVPGDASGAVPLAVSGAENPVPAIPSDKGEELVAGLYGVALGRAFFAESMFHTRPYAAKIALALLAERLWKAGFLFIDCQMPTPHVLGYGAVLLPRTDYLELLRQALGGPAPVWPSPEGPLAGEA